MTDISTGFARRPNVATFKVLFDDCESRIGEGDMSCPICGEKRPTGGGDWSTPEQERYIKSVAMNYGTRRVNQVLVRGARAFNRCQPRKSFISMSLHVKPSAPPVVIPISALEVMQQRLACESCGCRYASIGAAFFCPACGHNSAAATVDSTVQAVRDTIQHLPSIRQTLVEAGGKDTAQDVARQLVESQLATLVGSFQRFAEAVFSRLPNAPQFKTSKNTFQRLGESSTLWRDATSKGYEEMLTSAEMSDLVRLFQQRHLIAHRDGIVDQEYIDKSGDTTYAVGQRLVVRESAVLRLADLIDTLAGEVRKLAPA